MWKYLNKGISTPLAIGIILILVIIVGGFTWWQYSEIENNIEIPQLNFFKKECTKGKEENCKKSCGTNEDCKYTCTCRGNCIAKDEICLSDKDVVCEKMLGTCRCINNQCKYIEDETTGWQTYRNEEYGFEFKNLFDCELKDLPEKDEEERIIEYYFNCGQLKITMAFCLSPNPLIHHSGYGGFTSPTELESSIEEGYAIKEKNGLFDEYYSMEYGGMGSWTTIINAIVQNNSKNYYITFSISLPDGSSGFEDLPTSFRDPNYLSRISKEGREWVINKMKEENITKIFNQMLSTFKFIE